MRTWAREEDPGRWRCNAGVPEAGEASRTLCGRYRQRKKEGRCQHPDAGGMSREFHEVTGEKIQKVRQYELLQPNHGFPLPPACGSSHWLEPPWLVS